MRDILILRKLKVWCLLLLAAVFAHALLPISIPEARASGSPFSPSTVEVSTGHVARASVVRHVAPQRDPLGGGQAIAQAVAFAPDAAALRSAASSAQVSTRSGWRCALSQPRAPPFA
ncbi:hypothetical protein [Novosphingobium kaempferiae]|uniref:hypothetical protein n=1 Tax=Novosphingobium kaempferiae TaxID=2896849 RepID=UPI001E43690A|nr:hypothetical protein [Novosphingobium kaempferiae]